MYNQGYSAIYSIYIYFSNKHRISILVQIIVSKQIPKNCKQTDSKKLQENRELLLI